MIAHIIISATVYRCPCGLVVLFPPHRTCSGYPVENTRGYWEITCNQLVIRTYFSIYVIISVRVLVCRVCARVCLFVREFADSTHPRPSYGPKLQQEVHLACSLNKWSHVRRAHALESRSTRYAYVLDQRTRPYCLKKPHIKPVSCKFLVYMYQPTSNM
jgi:hypothetical protein